jgi:branched-chain amino acid transport system permease protein
MILGQQIILGLMIGGLYGLAAVGLSLVFGVLKVLNVAHGELIMLGGYGAFWLFALLGLGPLASLALVVPAALLAGLALYAALFGFVVRADEETRVKNSLLIGFGLALALHALAVRLWTADERSITTPYDGAVIGLGPLSIPLIRLVSLVLAFALIGVLHLLLTRWRWGQAVRATAEDWQAALLTGIDVRRAYLLAFAAGTGLAGAAGTLVSVGYSISPAIGLEWTLKALIVVVLAGLGSVFGTFFGGLFLGVAEAASGAAFGGPYRELAGLVIFVLVLLLRPRGLVGRGATSPGGTSAAGRRPSSSPSPRWPCCRSSPRATTSSTSSFSSCWRSRWPRAGTSSRGTPGR